MNRLEAFFIEHIAPYTPFGTTMFYPAEGVNVTVKTVETNKFKDKAAKIHGKENVKIPGGTTAKLMVDEVEVTVKDYREHYGHTAGATIQVGDDETLHSLDADHSFANFAMGLFYYTKSHSTGTESRGKSRRK